MRNAYLHLSAIGFLTAWCLSTAPARAQDATTRPAELQPFRIRVVDEDTGRGVPLVELETVNHVRCVTDSAGLVAFLEPGLMRQPVFFFVRSHGYRFPKDDLGMEGTALKVRPGGGATLRIRRLNLAERLYRITGEGIYRDTVLLGERPPIRKPLLNAQVAGQDSTQAALYRGKIYWFWGDTARPRYPLGHFQVSGATSLPPEKGGLDPSVGIDLEYFVDEEGFSKKMCPMSRPNQSILVWIDGVLAVRDAAGREVLLCSYSQRQDLTTVYEQGLAVFNDENEIFEKDRELDLKETWRFPRGHAVPHREDGAEYFLFCAPFPVTRVRASLEAVRDGAAYESFTPLAPGARYEKAQTALERDAAGRLVWGWKKDADPLSQAQEKELIAAGKMKDSEARFQVRDRETNKPVAIHGGTVHWNAFRKKWILIALEIFGSTSLLGEVWYAEADSPTGPWTAATKIVTHDRYTFYNPVHHPFFDQEGGRLIYFEGTYATTFSGNDNPTPRYEYNQILYRLDLADPRLRASPASAPATATAPTQTVDTKP